MIADGGIIHDASGLRACCVLPGRKIMPGEFFFFTTFFLSLLLHIHIHCLLPVHTFRFNGLTGGRVCKLLYPLCKAKEHPSYNFLSRLN